VEFVNAVGNLLSVIITIRGREGCDGGFQLRVQVSIASCVCGCVSCIWGLYSGGESRCLSCDTLHRNKVLCFDAPSLYLLDI